MKRLLFLLLLTIPTALIHAQLQFGIKAGINVSFQTPPEGVLGPVTGPLTIDSEVLNRHIVSYQFGAVLSYQLNDRWKLSTDLLYNAIGGKIVVTSATLDGTGFEDHFDSRLDYFSLPLMVHWSPLNRWYLEFGPQISYLVSDETWIPFTKDLEFGLNFGTSVQLLKNFDLQLRYYLGLPSTVDTDGIFFTDVNGEPIDESGLDVRNRSIQFSGVLYF